LNERLGIQHCGSVSSLFNNLKDEDDRSLLNDYTWQKCRTPLYLSSIKSMHEVKIQ